MKVTKEMLAEMRHNIAEPQGFSAQRGDLVELPVGLLQALLDERKALRAELRDLATAYRARANMWPDKPEAPLYFAVARDIEEHPALTLGEDEG